MKLLFTSILLTLSASTFAQIPSYSPSNGLVGWWPFNGNANDESGNGNNGTVNGATLTTDRFGVADKAYSFDGVNDLIRVAHQASLNLTGDYTISVWFIGDYQNIFNNNWVLVAKRDDNGTCCSPIVPFDVFIPFNATNYAVVCMAYANNGNYTFATPPNSVPIAMNLWQNIIITNQADNLNFYLNGTNIYSISLSNSLRGPNTADMLFGSVNREIGVEWMNGKLDDIGIWNRALTACEIQDLYHTQLGYTTVNAGSDQTICRGELVTLQGVGGSSLTWNNGVINGVPFEPTQTDSYVLTGSDSLGCIGIDTVLVSVLEATTSSQSQTAIDSYTWPVNGQTYTQSGVYVDTLVNAAGCDSVVTLNLELDFTGIESNTPTTFKLYPNPVKEELFIKGMTEAVLPFEVYSTDGKKVLSGTTSGAIDMNALKKGSYQLKMKEQTIPFVKQ